MELVALGTSGSWPSAGRACSGYLVSVTGRRQTAAPSAVNILVDAGNGSTSNLQRLVGFDQLDAVFISHRHPDHWSDLIGMFHALRLDPRLQRDPLPLYAPEDLQDAVKRMLSDSSAAQFGEIFDVHGVSTGDVVTVASSQDATAAVTVEVFEAVHSVPAISLRFSAFGRTVAYSGDTADHPGLVECARQADVFLCEATWQGPASSYPPGVHLTAAQAGAVASRARAGRLVLTHVSGGLDTAVSLREAQIAFDGPIDIAVDMDRWTLAAHQ